MSKLKQGNLLPSPPAYTFGTSRKEIAVSNTPGPQYNLDKALVFKNQNNTNGYSFPKSKSRDQLKEGDNIPGPAAYNSNKGFFSKIGGVIAKRYKNFDDANQLGVGPGSYQPKVNNYNSGIKIPKAGKDGNPDKKDLIPGPQQYNPDIIKFKTKFPQATIGKSGNHNASSKNDENSTEQPGPGAYNSKEFIGKTKKDNYKFSRAGLGGNDGSAKKKENIIGPGPGNYEVGKSSFKINGGYTIAKRYKSFKDIEIPGPGAYKSEKSSLTHGKMSFGKAGIKDNPKQTQNTGPDYYDIPATVPDWPKYLLQNKPLKIHLQFNIVYK